MMKRRGVFGLFIVILLMLALAFPAWAVEQVNPNKSHQGQVGKSERIWKYGYFDELVGDGVNAYLYGFKYKVVAQSSSKTLTVAESGKMFATTGFISLTLPAHASGLTYSFAAKSGSVNIKPPSGHIYNICSTTNTVAYSTIVGDSLTIVSDGTDWYAFDKVGTWACKAGW